MILQKLSDYYHRLAHDPDSDIAPEGFERKEIPFVIVLDAQGVLVNLKDTRETKDKKLRAKVFLVPQGVKKTSGIKANLLWDSAEYVLGLSLDGAEDPKNAQRHAAFRQTVEDVFGKNPDDEGVQAILHFLDRGDMSAVTEHPNWQGIKAAKAGSFTFALAGDDAHLVAMRPAVQQKIAALAGQGDDSAGEGYCLLTAEQTPIARMHTAIKGVWGAQSSGANIVSFNFDSAKSFGKDQGANSPIGISAMFAYTTALNTLLGKDSQQRFQAGDASVVFWAKNATPLETNLRMMFDEPPKENPDRMRDAVQVLRAAPHTGHKPIFEDDTPFYILGLSPNAARISVRFWRETTVKELAKNILRHFEDTALIHSARDPECLSLFRLLNATAAQGKSENVPPNLAGVMVEAVLSGAPYPYSLLQNAVMRLRAELSSDLHYRDYPRAALIKACLNRRVRHKLTSGKELTVALDTENDNIGYCLGRLFAALEMIQEDAHSGPDGKSHLNATIRDRYYGAASSTPVAVFGTLMKLSNHHLSKIGNPEKKRGKDYWDKKLRDITGKIEAKKPFPAHLTLDDQGRFAIGYYHQRQNFYAKTQTATPAEKEAA